ncbi:MAG TPA: type IV secretory system conjugative DNA transfer family protein [Candidatus Angelobacter sp.]|nr:type IV secretory system conjugative DNA transfer family protein [Candidatus Angelobacter sp.]
MIDPVEGGIALIVILSVTLAGWIAVSRFHLTPRQLVEASIYLMLMFLGIGGTAAFLLTGKSRREKQWPHPPMVIPARRDEKFVRQAYRRNSIVLGYDVHRKPWFWPDETRVMQTIVLGQSGSGKTTLLKNIITQDLCRVMGTPNRPRRMPMLIFDGKGDLEYFYDLLPHVHRAGRMHQLRILNPARPDISVGYNPFYCKDDNYMAIVNMVFGSFNLHDEFFAKHQLNYLADIVRVLYYTGFRFNFHDVLVLALDEERLKLQVEIARKRIANDASLPVQRRLNFEMSVRNLFQSFADRDRVPKIQGLLNECMTFLDDELSVITGPYEDLLSIEEVIDQDLILFVSLNVNKNTEPVKALGKMLLQNLQLVVGEKYEDEQHRRQADRPTVSVILDEFAPFGYRNFAQILQTARGTNTAFLFAMQSLSQLMQVGKGFKEEVSSAPNTTILMRTRDEETARYFRNASAEHTVTKRSYSTERSSLFGFETFRKTDRATETETRETRSLDEHIKNLPKGQMEILQTDDTLGTLHRLLHVRPPSSVASSLFEPRLYPRLLSSLEHSKGANLRFKSNVLPTSQKFGRR